MLKRRKDDGGWSEARHVDSGGNNEESRRDDHRTFLLPFVAFFFFFSVRKGGSRGSWTLNRPISRMDEGRAWQFTFALNPADFFGYYLIPLLSFSLFNIDVNVDEFRRYHDHFATNVVAEDVNLSPAFRSTRIKLKNTQVLTDLNLIRQPANIETNPIKISQLNVADRQAIYLHRAFLRPSSLIKIVWEKLEEMRNREPDGYCE